MLIGRGLEARCRHARQVARHGVRGRRGDRGRRSPAPAALRRQPARARHMRSVQRLDVAREARRRRTARLPVRSALEAGAQRGAARRIAGQRDDGRCGRRRRRGTPARRRPTACSRLAATRWAKVSPLERDHRHADPERLARGGVRVARPGVEIDVGARPGGQVRLERQHAARRPAARRRCRARARPRSAPPARWCSIAAATAPHPGSCVQQRAPAVEHRRREILYDWWKAHSTQRVLGHAPVARASTAAAARGARRWAGSSAASGRSSR